MEHTHISIRKRHIYLKIFRNFPDNVNNKVKTLELKLKNTHAFDSSWQISKLKFLKKSSPQKSNLEFSSKLSYFKHHAWGISKYFRLIFKEWPGIFQDFNKHTLKITALIWTNNQIFWPATFLLRHMFVKICIKMSLTHPTKRKTEIRSVSCLCWTSTIEQHFNMVW